MEGRPWLVGLWSHSGAAPVLWDRCVLLIAWSWGSRLQNRGPALPLVPTASSLARGPAVPREPWCSLGFATGNCP